MKNKLKKTGVRAATDRGSLGGKEIGERQGESKGKSE